MTERKILVVETPPHVLSVAENMIAKRLEAGADSIWGPWNPLQIAVTEKATFILAEREKREVGSTELDR